MWAGPGSSTSRTGPVWPRRAWHAERRADRDPDDRRRHGARPRRRRRHGAGGGRRGGRRHAGGRGGPRRGPRDVRHRQLPAGLRRRRWCTRPTASPGPTPSSSTWTSTWGSGPTTRPASSAGSASASSSRPGPKAAYYVEGLGDPEAECRRYAGLLRRHPLDLCCLGIGENGHLAFNDPPVADFDDPLDVKVVELDAACRRQQVNEGHFAGLDDVPTHAITVTIPALLRAGRVLAVVPEARKAEPVARRPDRTDHHRRARRRRCARSPTPPSTSSPTRPGCSPTERGRLCGGLRPPMPGDVVEMMDWVVEHVAAEARDAEAGAVAAPAAAGAIARPARRRSASASARRRLQLRRDDGRDPARRSAPRPP